MQRIWFNRRGMQWWRVLRVSLLWIGIGIVAVVVLQPRPAPPAGAAADPASGVLVTQPGLAPLLAHSRRVAAPASAAVPGVPATSAPATVEICGIGRVTTAPDDPDGHQVLEAHRSPAEMDAWLGSLVQGGDERARAAALLMRGGESHERLALLASRTSDPVVYAYALQACQAWEAPGKAGACRGVGPEHWPRLDPGNAMVWLFAANAARVRGDAAAVAEAMRRAAQAETHRHPGMTLVRSLMPEEPRNLSRTQTALMLTQAIGMQAALPYSHYTVLGTECSESALAQPGRREACSRIAERMVGGPDSLVDVSVGVRIGERLGWPKERVAEMRAQLQAMGTANPGLGKDPLSCDKIDRLRKYMIDVARIGERAAILEHVAASGMTLEELSRRNRAQLDAVVRAMPQGVAR